MAAVMFKPSSTDEDARYEVYLPQLPRGLPPWQGEAPAAQPTPKDRRARFEELAKANLRALYVAQLRSLRRAAYDPRVTKAHWQVHTEIIARTNITTGMAYPGRDLMAASIIYYDDARAPQHYAPQTISNLTNDLRHWGYLEHDKRAPNGAGRAVAHYVTTEPDITYLQEQIAEWCRRERKAKADLPSSKVSQDNGLTYSPSKVTQEADLLLGIPETGADLLLGPSKSPKQSRKHAGQLEGNRTGSRGADAPLPPIPYMDRPGDNSAALTPSPQPQPSKPVANGDAGARADGKAAMAAALGGQAAYAYRNVLVSDSGRITIGEEFRAELRETYTDSQIERGIERAPSQSGSADPVKLLGQIRRCCSYAKQDDVTTDKKLAAQKSSPKKPLSRYG
jgi:hypothetical protein